MFASLTATMQRNRRYSGDDRHLGPFITLSCHGTVGDRPLAALLSSGDEEYPGCHLQLSAAGWSLLVELPQWVLRPHAEKIQAKTWDALTVARMGRDWYLHTDRRDYGFRFSDDFLQVFLGRQTHDSSTTRSWNRFIPWREWRLAAERLYDLNGKLAWQLTERQEKLLRRSGESRFEVRREAVRVLPKARFMVGEMDGTQTVAVTHIEEHEHRRGTGWFRWLSLVTPARRRRSLVINFATEVGPEKGSFKGGLMGTGIEMLPGELHAQAFARFCELGVTGKHGHTELILLQALDTPEGSAR